MKLRLCTIIVLGAFASALNSVPAFAANSAGRKLGVGLYGSNGHQLSAASLAKNPHARLVAVAQLRAPPAANSGVKEYPGLDAMLADPTVEIVSLCSPQRADQARDAIRCLEAGKHVYAEKPCALTERELDQILAAARRSGREFHEMAGTVFVQPYREMRRLVKEGAVGEVIQVLVQKSYPYFSFVTAHLAAGAAMPLSLEAELHPLRMLLRAKQNIRSEPARKSSAKLELPKP